MLEFGSALNSGMGRRVFTMTLAALALVLLAFVTLGGRESAVQVGRSATERIGQAARGSASELAGRLAAAEAIVQALATTDIGADGTLLRQRLLDSRVFKSLVIVDPDSQGFAHNAPHAFALTAPQLAAVRAGRSALLSVALGTEEPRSLYFARAVRARGVGRVALFELAPDWLWQGMHDLPTDLEGAVVGNHGEILYRTAAVSPEVAKLFSAALAGASNRAGSTESLSWQSEGTAWTGTLCLLPANANHLSSTVLGVVVSEPRASLFAHAAPILGLLPILLMMAILVSAALAALVGAAYLPALRALRAATLDLGEGRPATVRVAIARDELGAVVGNFNRAAQDVTLQLRTLTTLSEIDALLLGSHELEAVLDGVLARVCEVSRCHSAGIMLLDKDAPGHGRMFMAASNGAQLPVSRVLLDDLMLDTLGQSKEGLTIARCEEQRHSFLQPMTAVGSAFFWVWPVIAGDNVAALLAVGYAGTPTPDLRIARYGTNCAARLALALSTNARTELLYRQAHFDPLTSLPNRLLFRDRLAQELSSANTNASRGALLYIDLDHFKQVNDTLGHHAGDQVLTIVAQRLRSCVKDGDTVARLAGDEFTVILRSVVDPDGALAVADRVIESLQLPVNIAGRDHFVKASIGLTLFPDDGNSIDELMRNADLAMYRAKESGRGKSVFFDRKMMQIESNAPDSGLYRALKRREFSLYYQPQYTLGDGRIAGVEALLRWQTPAHGMRSPADFVPAAEEAGLIIDIGSWVLEAATAQMAQWREQGIAPPRLAVNVSAQQLRDGGFPALLRRLLDRHNLPAEFLELELTEGVFADENAFTSLERISRMGVRLSLDDFGTGESSLTNLRRYPVRAVKIDRSFIEDLPGNPASASIAETIIVMAHSLGKVVVAEGVETVEQLDFLRERRCDVVQGYYLARPLTTVAMSEMLMSRQPVLHGELSATG
ncbi:MAG: EAL domain-containing protein [Steroidobacteraceae bacterium]